MILLKNKTLYLVKNCMHNLNSIISNVIVALARIQVTYLLCFSERKEAKNQNQNPGYFVLFHCWIYLQCLERISFHNKMESKLFNPM